SGEGAHNCVGTKGGVVRGVITDGHVVKGSYAGRQCISTDRYVAAPINVMEERPITNRRVQVCGAVSARVIIEEGIVTDRHIVIAYMVSLERINTQGFVETTSCVVSERGIADGVV